MTDIHENEKQLYPKILDWILGPDFELFINRKTRISFLLVCFGSIGLIATYHYLTAQLPFFIVPCGFTILTLTSGIRLYHQADERIQLVFKDAAQFSFLAIIITIILSKPFQSEITQWVTMDFLLIYSIAIYGACIFVFYRFKL